MGNCLRRRPNFKPQSEKNIETKELQEEIPNEDTVILKLEILRDKLLAQKRGLYKNAEKVQNEAKELIKDQKKERAIFALKRQKLYENILQEIENQYLTVQKTIMDVESKLELAKFTQVLRETNELIKEFEMTIKYEQLHKIGQEIMEREEDTKRFNKLFEEHHVNNAEIDSLFEQYTSEINEENAERQGRQLEDTSGVDEYSEKRKDITTKNRAGYDENLQAGLLI